jgi:hypothetical protein
MGVLIDDVEKAELEVKPIMMIRYNNAIFDAIFDVTHLSILLVKNVINNSSITRLIGSTNIPRNMNSKSGQTSQLYSRFYYIHAINTSRIFRDYF